MTENESSPSCSLSTVMLNSSRMLCILSRYFASSFSFSRSIRIEEYPFLPVILEISRRFSYESAFLTMRVPGFSGSNVLLILIGIPHWLTGLTASSWRTSAPLSASSLSSLYIITGTLSGCFTMRGSAISSPGTSVQFSYKSAFAADAIIAPVMSDPPLEKVTTSPVSFEP